MLTVVSVLLGVAGLITLIYGLVVKKKCMTISGSIMTFIAIVMMITGVFCAAKRAAHLVSHKIKADLECFHHFGPGPFGPMGMRMDSLMECNDSIMSKGDSCCAKMKMKCGGHMKNEKCMKMKCSPSECKANKPAEKK